MEPEPVETGGGSAAFGLLAWAVLPSVIFSLVFLSIQSGAWSVPDHVDDFAHVHD